MLADKGSNYRVKLFIYSDLALCPDDAMSNITSSFDMESNGWFVDVDYTNTNIEARICSWFPTYRSACGVDTFFGYKRINQVGTVSYTFKGSGNIALNIGNCYNQGFVVIYLNNVIKTYLKGGEYTKFEFEYKKDDELLITESGIAIIKLSNISVSCFGKFDNDFS